MRLGWSLLLLISLGCAATGQEGENPTAQLLGPREGWGACRLELQDVHGLWGGTQVIVDGTGHCWVQLVDREKQARRYRFVIPPEQVRGLFELAIQVDLTQVEIPERPGVPDEARPRLVIVGANGRRELAKWANDQVEGFDRVEAALAALAKQAEQKQVPYATVPYDPAWHPLEGAEVEVLLYSGRPDPRWDLSPDALGPILERLQELPEATPVQRPGLGYRGFRITFHGGGPGRDVEVFQGTVLIQQADGSSVTRADAHGLEAWLREQAQARGIELP